jgi:hypothetical protein
VVITKKAIATHFSTPRMRVSTTSRLSGGLGRAGRAGGALGVGALSETPGSTSVRLISRPPP